MATERKEKILDHSLELLLIQEQQQRSPELSMKKRRPIGIGGPHRQVWPSRYGIQHRCLALCRPVCPFRERGGVGGTSVRKPALPGLCGRLCRTGSPGSTWCCGGRFWCGIKAGGHIPAPAGKHRPAMRVGKRLCGGHISTLGVISGVRTAKISAVAPLFRVPCGDVALILDDQEGNLCPEKRSSSRCGSGRKYSSW